METEKIFKNKKKLTVNDYKKAYKKNINFKEVVNKNLLLSGTFENLIYLKEGVTKYDNWDKIRFFFFGKKLSRKERFFNRLHYYARFGDVDKQEQIHKEIPSLFKRMVNSFKELILNIKTTYVKFKFKTHLKSTTNILSILKETSFGNINHIDINVLKNKLKADGLLSNHEIDYIFKGKKL